MKTYYVTVNPKANGEHEVHESKCIYLPNFINRNYLGDFETCEEAVAHAKKTFKQSNGCKTCSVTCHTSQT